MYSDLLKVAEKIAQEAAEVILVASEHPKKIGHKGRTDLVTDTDHRSEELICAQIEKEFPEHTILAEERGKSMSDSEWLWVVDPLDGTTNFVHNYPSFAVSIGCLYEQKPVLGVVVELPSNKMYSAVIENGATCNGEKIEVSKVNELSQSLLVTGFGYEHAEIWEANMELFREFTDLTQGVRRLGAASVDLCHVASGKVDGFWEFDLHPWDTAAGIVILQEAGGAVSRMDGGEFSIYDKQFLSSNGILHPQLLGIIGPNIDNLKSQGIEL